ncbi:cell division protein FtsX [Alphaproteobacteria bacterium]|nr:cell division protein FtsX [Alphaproteobacteria bacterium]
MKSNVNTISVKQLRQAEPFKRRSTMRLRIIKYGISNFLRNGWLSLASIMVMSFTLLTVFVAGAATVMLNDTLEDTKVSKMDLALYMKADTPDDIVDKLKGVLEQNDNVAWVDIKSKADGVQRLKDSNAIDAEIITLLAENGESPEDALPVVVSIHVKDIYQTDALRDLVDSDNSEFKTYVDPALYDKQFWNGESQKTVQNIASLTGGAQLVGFALAGVFLLITILVIFNTVRLAIFARREEIEMEKLIGAEKSYVRGPFLVEAEIYGIVSSLVALGIGYGLILTFLPDVMTGASAEGLQTAMLHLVLVSYWPLVVIGMMAIGILIGNLSSRLAVRKYLRY